MGFQIEHWHWWVLTLLFVAFGAFTHGAYFIPMTVAAAVVGAMLWFNPETLLVYQLLVFGLITLAGVGLSMFLVKDSSQGVEQQNVATQGRRYVGNVLTLQEPIVNGFGSVEIDGQVWRVRGENMPAATQVRVVGIDGIDPDLLKVEKVKPAGPA